MSERSKNVAETEYASVKIPKTCTELHQMR